MEIHTDGPNRTRITLSDGSELFISYSTCVATRLPDGSRYRSETAHSSTASKHIGQWCMTDAPRKPQAYFDALLASR